MSRLRGVHSALWRSGVLLRLVAQPRTPARRRSARTSASRRMAGAVNGHRSVRALGDGRRRRIQRRLNVRASMPGHTSARLRLAACERERRRSPRRLCHSFVVEARRHEPGGRPSAAVGSTEPTILASWRSRPRGRHDYRNRGKPAARRPAKAAVRRPTAAPHRSACASSGESSSPPRPARQLSA